MHPGAASTPGVLLGGQRSRAGLLFAYDWDRLAFDQLPGVRPHWNRAGFDLFSFPSNVRLVGFDMERMARRLAAHGRRNGWSAVLSHHEQFGALTAALVAEKLGLPGASVESILAAQHKLHARRVLQAVAPEANLAFEPLDAAYGDPIPAGIAYPRYVKPVKAAFSVLARRVNDAAQLHKHTRFGRGELWVIRHLVEPFERVCRERLPQAGTAHQLMLEEPVPASVPQFNLDGWVAEGHVHALGVVDAVMYPDTQAFMRWEYPSRLAPRVQARALDVARRFLQAIGYRLGFFNLEFFHDPVTDRLSVIECNPRLASQFSDLYQRVDGRNPHAMSLALALGDDPLAIPRTEPTAGAAASLVYRTFEGEPIPATPPKSVQQRWQASFPDGLLFPMPKSGSSLVRDFKWTGSHRYGIVHLGAADRAALQARAQEASAVLGWPAPYAHAEPARTVAAVADQLPLDSAGTLAAMRPAS